MKRISIYALLLMLLGSYSGMSPWTQESLDKLRALNKNERVIFKSDKIDGLVKISIYYLDVSDQDLSDLKLDNIDFFFCNFYNAKFNKATMDGVKSIHSDFRKAHFEDTDLEGVWFKDKSPLDGATFKKAYLYDARLEINPSVNFIKTDKGEADFIEVESFEVIRAKEDRSKYILKSGVDIWPYDLR